MIHRPAFAKAGLTAAAMLAAMPGADAASPPADARVAIHYSISMIGVPIGRIIWAIDLGAHNYQASASGKASRAVGIFLSGEGRIATQGIFEADKASPTFFSSNVIDDGDTTGLQMTFENGNVKALRIDDPPNKADRVPIGDEHKRGVTDPLSAMLIPSTVEAPPMSPGQCNRTLPIFDGQRRYDLVMAFKRMDTLKLDRGYSGPALVCAVMLRPIAGYRADSTLVKYVGGRTGLEIWFMPIEGTHVIAPGLLKMPTGVGTLEIEAERVERAPPRPAPPAPATPPAPDKSG